MKISAITPYRYTNNQKRYINQNYGFESSSAQKINFKDSYEYKGEIKYEYEGEIEYFQKMCYTAFAKIAILKKLKKLGYKGSSLEKAYKDFARYDYYRTRLFERILNDEALSKNKGFMEGTENILAYNSGRGGYRNISTVLDKLSADKDILKDEDISKDIARMLSIIINKPQADLAVEFLSHKEIYQNKDFMHHAKEILFYTEYTSDFLTKKRGIEKFLSNKEVMKNENALKYFADAIHAIYGINQLQVLSEILSHEELYSNPDFMQNCRYIVYNSPKEAARAKIKIIRRFLSDKDLKNNKEAIKEFSKLLAGTSYDFYCELMQYRDKYFKRIMKEALGVFSAEQIVYLVLNDTIFDILNSKEFNKNKKYIKQINNAGFKLTDRNDFINKLLNQYYDNYSTASLKSRRERLDFYQRIITDEILDSETIKALDLEEEIKQLQKYLGHIIIPNEVSKKDGIDMMKGFFANNSPELDKTLKNADFTQYGHTGLPLAYPREQFVSDLKELLDGLDEKKQNEILNKLNITLKNGGYNGIINLDGLSLQGIEGKVLKLANKFIKENSILTGDENLDNALNSLIKGIPEFINVIGKKQHSTHDYTLDIHILKVLQEALNNPEYKKLTTEEQFCLKFAVIMHDIAKPEGEKDDEHPYLSALYAYDILNKSAIKLPYEMKNRIFELIKNHHWLADYNNNKKTIGEIAGLFRRKGDFKISQIITEADLKSVDKKHYFYNKYLSALSDSIKPIEEKIDEINKFGQIILTNKIINPKKLAQKATVEYKGNKYQVVDFTKLGENENLFEYGFEPDTTPKNFRLLVHTVHYEGSSNLENVWYLGNPCFEGFLCASYVTPKNHPTYNNNKFGVSLETENINIANATPYNQGSGSSKNFKNFIDIITSPINEHRTFIPNSIKKYLSIQDSEYSALYNQIQRLKYISQPDNIDSISEFQGKKLKQAISKAQDSIIKKKDEHNEINMLNPKINAFVAKVNSIDEIPQPFLEFAQKHNLPIYILGK